MDDKRFDDIIKKKAEAFEDTGHDAGALTDFRRRMADLPVKNSGNSLSKTGYLLGAMTLFTLINFGIVWYFSEGRHLALDQELKQLKTEQNQLFSQGNSPSPAKGIERIKVDTVYVFRDLLTTTDNRFKPDGGLPEDQGTDYKLLASDMPLSRELEEFLLANNLLLKEEDGELILLVSSAQVTPVNKFEAADNNRNTSPMAPTYLSEVATFEVPETKKPVEKKKMPNKMLWALEKHNHSGVDFQFGVEGKYHQSNFDVGEGELNGGIGLMTEVLFSPVWRLETGVHFGARAYKIGQEEIDQLPESFFDDYPGYNDTLGVISALESEALLIKVPFNLKRFAPLDHNKRWYISAGLTPQWTRDQHFEYKYSITNPEPIDDEFVSFTGASQEVADGYYTTTVNLGLGAEVYLNERLRWQLGLFYQKGLGKAGYEQRKLVSSYGIKSSIWFNKP